jgi:hypothetical protein
VGAWCLSLLGGHAGTGKQTMWRERQAPGPHQDPLPPLVATGEPNILSPKLFPLHLPDAPIIAWLRWNGESLLDLEGADIDSLALWSILSVIIAARRAQIRSLIDCDVGHRGLGLEDERILDGL